MGSWTALVASTVIGTLVLLSILRFNEDVSVDLYADVLEKITYEQMMETASILEYDFSRIGYGINDPTVTVITQAAADSVTFLLDINDDGLVDSVQYHLGDTTSASSTPNPRDKILYRVVNGGSPMPASSGLTEFQLTYYDAVGNTTTVLQDITTIEINMTFESTIIYDGRFARLTWHAKISPSNLVNK